MNEQSSAATANQKEGVGRRRRGAAPLLIAVAVLATCALLLRWRAGDLLEPEKALAALRGVQNEAWTLPAFLLSYLVLTTLFFPAALFHMVAAAAWGFPSGLLLNVLACNAGASVQFLVSRRLGRQKVGAWFAKRQFKALEFTLSPGLREAIAIRVFPLPTMAVNAGSGLSSMRWRDFALGTLIGTFPVIAIYTYAAATLVEGLAGVQERVLLPIVLSALGLLAVTYGPRVWLRLRRRA